jgi:hypothetical protein
VPKTGEQKLLFYNIYVAYSQTINCSLLKRF